MTTAILSERRFRAWLAAKPDHTIVGHAAEGGDCPLAEFLAAHGAPDPSVDCSDFTLDLSWRPYRRLPPWARRTVELIDGFCAGPITAGELREVLG